MSWIEKELKKREAAATGSSKLEETAVDNDSASMAALWGRFEKANDALPQEIKLRVETNLPANAAIDMPGFLVWLRAPNGAGLGFTGDAIRYAWPERGQRRSNNFWISWRAERGYSLNQRISSSASGLVLSDYRFDERGVDHMIKCLVTGRRVKTRAVRKRRLWLF